MKKRKLRNIEVSEIGMGCMAFSHGYGQIPEEEYAIKAIQAAFQHGCTFFDTAEIYSPGLSGIGHNEQIVGKALSGVREQAVIATKFFVSAREARSYGSVSQAIRAHLAGSMKRLQTEYIDLYYLHRVSDIPIEQIALVMKDLIEEGKIGGWGLSQADVDLIEKAQKITPLSAVQNIYSMVERDAEKAVIPYCEAHNIGFVPFSPIASGLLSGKINEQTRFETYDDVRSWVPQLSKNNLRANQPIVDLLEETAQKKHCTPAQTSLAWILKKVPIAVPIHGSKNIGRIIENLDAASIELSDAEFEELDQALNALPVYGHRGFTI